MKIRGSVRRLNERIGAARGPEQPLREHLAVLATARGGHLRYISEDLLELLSRVEAVEARLDTAEAERGRGA